MDSLITAQSIAISTAWLLAGYSAHDSFSTVPTLLPQPAAVSTRLFAQTYANGALFAIPTGLTSLAAFSYMACSVPDQRALWGPAAVSMLITLPWTRVIMFPGIQRLIHLSENPKEREEAESNGDVLRLLKTWKAQNWLRAAMFVTSGILGLQAAQI